MFRPIAKNEMARKYRYVCHTVSCTELFDPATTAAAMNCASFGSSVSLSIPEGKVFVVLLIGTHQQRLLR